MWFLRALSPSHCKPSAQLESILPMQNLFFIHSTMLRWAYALLCLSVGMDVNHQLLGSQFNSLEDSSEIPGSSSFMWEFFCICHWTEVGFCNRLYVLQPYSSLGKCCSCQSSRIWQSCSELLSLWLQQFEQQMLRCRVWFLSLSGFRV